MTDLPGSPRVITDANGSVKSRRDFMPFGEELVNNTGERPTNLKYGITDGIRQKFTGYQKDEETQLDFAEARMYENRHARFTAVDPLLASGKSADPQTFNRYVYVLNNPLAYTDPSGLQVATNLVPCDRSVQTCNYTVTGERSVNKDSPLASITIKINEVIELGQEFLRQIIDQPLSLPEAEERSQTNYLSKSSGDFYSPNSRTVKQAWFSFAEGNRQLNEGIKAFDPFGIAAFNEAAVKADLGKGSNTDFLLAGGNFAFNTSTTFFGGGGTRKLFQEGGERLLFSQADNAAKPVIIGENVKRVVDYANRIDADFYKPWKVGFSEARQTRWINDMKKQGRQIIDIGPDFERRQTKGASINYNIERRFTKNYFNRIPVFQRFGKTSGGVPGLDF